LLFSVLCHKYVQFNIMLIEVRLTRVAFSSYSADSPQEKKQKGKTPKHRIGCPRAGDKVKSLITVT